MKQDGLGDVAMPHKNSVAPTDIKINGLRFIGYPLPIEQVSFLILFEFFWSEYKDLFLCQERFKHRLGSNLGDLLEGKLIEE